MKNLRITLALGCCLFALPLAATQDQSPLAVEIEVTGPGSEERLDEARVALIDFINGREDLTYGSDAPNPHRLVLRYVCTGDMPPRRDGSFKTACHTRLVLVKALNDEAARSLDGAEVVYAEESMWVTVIADRHRVHITRRVGPGRDPEPDLDLPAMQERTRQELVATMLRDAVSRLGGRIDADTTRRLSAEAH
ncbi:MAG: hypothetical protein GKS06_08650 [Acidobacteria bacterium]|nr:hypothetical protein [Acidobacteriota bacterium]